MIVRKGFEITYEVVDEPITRLYSNFFSIASIANVLIALLDYWLINSIRFDLVFYC